MLSNKKNARKLLKLIPFLVIVIFLFGLFSEVVYSQNGNDRKVNLQPPTSETTVPGLIGSITGTLLGIVGSLALLAFVVGGVRWLISGGKPEQIKKGANTMLYAIIGLFVVFGSYAILTTIIDTLTGGG